MSQVHRDHPEASPEEIEMIQLRQLMSVPSTSDEPRVERQCRDCGQPYTVPESKADSGSKWFSLCSSCIRWEL